VGSDGGEVKCLVLEDTKSIAVDGPVRCGKSKSSVFTGICGELWWIFGFSVICLGFLRGFLGVPEPESAVFGRKNVEKTWLIAWWLWFFRWLFSRTLQTPIHRARKSTTGT
jgi:hypothetical protein